MLNNLRLKLPLLKHYLFSLVEVLCDSKSVNYNMKFSVITFSILHTKGLKGKAK